MRLDPEAVGAREGWQSSCWQDADSLPIQVPGPVWALKALSKQYPSFRQPNEYDGICWYQHCFEVDPAWRDGGRVVLKFGGVAPTAHVWLNGHYLGHHREPLVGFQALISKALRFDRPNVLTLELAAWRELDRKSSVVGGLYRCGPAIYAGVELEHTAGIHLEELFVRPRIDEREARITVTVCNDSPQNADLQLRAHIQAYGDSDEQYDADAGCTLAANTSKPVELAVSMPNCRFWSVDDPFLYVLDVVIWRNETAIDGVAERFGMRQMTLEEGKLVLNHEPLMWRTSSPEFDNAPTISPILDRELTRRRIAAMKAMGFNGNRLHTHVYSREALDICDEMGFLLQVEPSVVSNFYELGPYPENRVHLVDKVKEVRNHPSVVVICLGNENSQLMRKPENQDRARVHLKDVKDVVPDHLILTGAGYQGEYPEIENAFQTPHLWSDHFKWAHGGLSEMPWAALKHLTAEGPIVLHEYGKYTVWPDPAEDALFREQNMPLTGNYGVMGRAALKDAGIDHLLPEIVDHSRKLSTACTKIAMEASRRLPGMQGYQYHCAFRVGNNRGFIDDLAVGSDPQFRELPESNGDVALLIDRDFRGRVMVAGVTADVNVYLSHFGHEDLSGATLSWEIVQDGKSLYVEKVEGISLKRGQNAPLCRIAFRSPEVTGRFLLRTVLTQRGQVVARNRWSFWSFVQTAAWNDWNAVLDMEDFQFAYDLMTLEPSLYRMNEFLSVYGGLKSSQLKAADSLKAAGISTVIADHWNDELAAFVRSGGNVVLLDRYRFPEEWHPEPDDVQKARKLPYCDVYKLYAPFRSGWDHGNAATIIHRHAMLGDYPHEGWCDLDFYDMIEGANSLRTQSLPGDVEPVIRVIPISLPAGGQIAPAPNEDSTPKRWISDDRCYLAESKIGSGRLLVCSLKLTNTVAGRFLLGNILRYTQTTKSEPCQQVIDR